MLPTSAAVGSASTMPTHQPPMPTQAEINRSTRPLLVDSGIGGAMAGMTIKGDVNEFGSIVCLPIGDKAREQNITYTAQMVGQGLIGQQNDNVIIACNTASTACDEACEVLTDFITRQAANPEKSIFVAGSPEMTRVQELAAEINAADSREDALQVVRSRVHEIVSPTAREAAGQVSEALVPESGAGMEHFLVVVDSTAGTAKSGTYPAKIHAELTAMMADKGFQPVGDGPTHMAIGENLSTENLGSFQGNYVENRVYTFQNDKGETKELLLQSRGNPAWVPAIEGNQLQQQAHVGTDVDLTQAMLARGSREAAASLEIEGQPELNEKFRASPNLGMLCCTHYPAMRDALSADWGADTQFLQQDQIVSKTVDTIEGSSGIIPDEPSSPRADVGLPKLNVTLGRDEISFSEQQEIAGIIQGVFPNVSRDITVSALGAEKRDRYNASHRDMEFNRESGGKEQLNKVYDDGMGMASRSVHTRWKQDTESTIPANRANATLVGSVPTDTKVAEPIQDQLMTSASTLRAAGMDNATLRETMQSVSELGRLMTGGEKRGLDILASRHEAGAALFNSAATLANVIQQNIENPENKTSVGIVTGFTVVDNDGNKVAGENDGPPGSIALAKHILDNGTPVTLVIDTGSEASVVAAALGAGIITDPSQSADENIDEVEAKSRTFADMNLHPNLTVEVVDHGPGSNEANPRTVGDVSQALQDSNTGLVISIERPSPNAEGRMSSMSGANISEFNADLSELFTAEGRSWETIGIGDGGNEIGTGGVKSQTSAMRKPDFTPVVNNGDKIAAEIETDHMVLASVSNNGAVGLAIASDMVLNRLPANQGAADLQVDDASGQSSARTIVEGYKTTVDRMFAEGISIDGVNKNNAQTVDGRTLHRPTGGEPQAIGSQEATHDDMFDAMVEIADRKNAEL